MLPNSDCYFVGSVEQFALLMGEATWPKSAPDSALVFQWRNDGLLFPVGVYEESVFQAES